MASPVLDRSAFLLRDDIAFLNHGSFGATPRVLIDEQRRWQERLEAQPVLFHRELPMLMDQARHRLGAFLGVDGDDVVFVDNATMGVNVAAHGLARTLKPGDVVLTTDHEYGACLRVWKQVLEGTGADLQVVPVPIPVPDDETIVASIVGAMHARTRILFISHITAPTAVPIPLEPILHAARERGIITVVDGAHAPGQIECRPEALGADFYTGNCHKWMCTPKGSAFLYVRRERQASLPPLVVSWGGEADTLHRSTFLDEHEYLGTRDVSPYLTVPAGIAWMQAMDWPTVTAVARRMVTAAVDRLLDVGGVRSLYSGAYPDTLQMAGVLLPVATDVARCKVALYAEGVEVVVHRWKDVPILRLSAHAHTSPSDIDRLVEALPAALVA